MCVVDAARCEMKLLEGGAGLLEWPVGVLLRLGTVMSSTGENFHLRSKSSHTTRKALSWEDQINWQGEGCCWANGVYLPITQCMDMGALIMLVSAYGIRAIYI